MATTDTGSGEVTLALDLEAAKSKLQRAREHIDEFDRIINALSDKVEVDRHDFDEQTSWVTVYFICPGLADESARLACIVGDAIHNMRSALDYVVTSLVVASGADLSKRHEFPVIVDEGRYERDVERSHLRGVTVGTQLVRSFQPFQRRAEPPWNNPDLLWALQRLSNSDKHRAILQLSPHFGVSGSFNFVGARILDSRGHASDPDQPASQPRRVYSFKLTGRPRELEFNGEAKIWLHLRAIPLDGEPDSTWHHAVLGMIHDRVSEVVDRFAIELEDHRPGNTSGPLRWRGRAIAPPSD